mmetsp:Transcript_34477/g.55926  ORF Transcript_34477/g.55926 Transcript_34477/m.55926 type:complete len:354 (-) Transcript_34477:32-1093(-)
MRMIEQMREQYAELLKDADLIDPSRFSSFSSSLRPRIDVFEDRHAHSWQVVHACLVAGLYPNMVRIDPRKRSSKFVSKHSETGLVKLHPSSVNSKEWGSEYWTHRWAVYFEKVKTEGGVFIYDTTEVSPLPLLIFGGGVGCKMRSFSPSDRQNDEDDGGRLAQGTEDGDVVAFVRQMCEANNGRYPMARLQSLMRRTLPELRARMGRLRQWIERHEDLFLLEKYRGRWELVLRKSEQGNGSSGRHGDGKYKGNKRRRLFLGVEDWIYFELENEADLAVLERIREQVKQILGHWINKYGSNTRRHDHARSSQSSSASSARSRDETRILDALCWAFQQKIGSSAEKRTSNGNGGY